MLYSTQLRLRDREIEAIITPMPTFGLQEDSEIVSLVHYVAPHANKTKMTFEVLRVPMAGGTRVERWVRLFSDDQRCLAFKQVEGVTLLGTHCFQQGDDFYETRVLSMREDVVELSRRRRGLV